MIERERWQFDMITHTYVRHDSILCVTWILYACWLQASGMIWLFYATHRLVWHNSIACLICMTSLHCVCMITVHGTKRNGMSREKSTAIDCTTLQHTHCSTPQHTSTQCARKVTSRVNSTLHHTTTHYNALQYTATWSEREDASRKQNTTTHCSAHIATHCNTYNTRTATRCNIGCKGRDESQNRVDSSRLKSILA